jgi:hypothetical protein
MTTTITVHSTAIELGIVAMHDAARPWIVLSTRRAGPVETVRVLDRYGSRTRAMRTAREVRHLHQLFTEHRI